MNRFIHLFATGAIVASGITFAARAAEPHTVALLEIGGRPPEQPGELAWLFGNTDNPSLGQIIDAVDDVAGDESYDGLVIRLKDADLNASQSEELGTALKRVQASGKRVIVFAENYGTSELVLASYADRVLAQDGGDISLPGLYTEEMYLGDALGWIGVKSDMVQIGDFKGANEEMTRALPSEAWGTNIEQPLDSLYASMRRPLLDGRHLSDSQLDEAMQDLWMADSAAAVKAGLVDEGIDLPTLTSHLGFEGDVKLEEIEAGDEGEFKAENANIFSAMALFSKDPNAKLTTPSIAVLHIDGAITDGDSSAGGMFGEASIGSRTIRNALEDILEDDEVKGVVLRIDSPGGSATASEVIWQGVRRVASKKPVWVSVGAMAASGGYYIAVAGDRIFIDPSSIVGSIGVVGGKTSMAGLYHTLHVNVVGRGRGPRAGMFTSDAPWSPDQLAMVRAKMTETFELFKKRVGAGRKTIDLEKTAGGWLFAGRKAIDMGLADEIGGEEAAIETLASSIDLDDYEVVDFPRPRPLREVLRDSLHGLPGGLGALAPTVAGDHSRLALVGPMGAAERDMIGEKAWRQVAPSLGALMQLRDEPVLLLSPRVIVIK